MKKYIAIYAPAVLVLLNLLIVTGGPAWAQDKDGKGKSKGKHKTEQGPKGNASMLIDAKKAEITGNLKEAEEQYRKYIDKYPEDANGYFQLSQLLSGQKNLQEAVSLGEKAVELDPGNSFYLLYLGDLYQQAARFDDAIRIFEKVVANNPGEIDYAYHLGALYAGMGKYNDAMKVYNRIEEMTGVTEDVSLQKEKICLARKDYDGAEDELKKLIAAFPSESRYYAMLAELYMGRDKQSEALAMYNKILEIDPDNAYIHMTLADFYRKQGNREKAFSELKLGFANPNLDVDTKVKILLSFYNVNMITDQLATEALELSDILVATHPSDAKSYTIRGDLLAQQKQYMAARDAYMQAIALDSSKYAIWEGALRLDATIEDFQHLVTYGKKAIELFPEMPGLYMITGMALYQLKEYQDAADMLNRGIKLVVDNDELLAQLYMFLGDTYHALNNPEESDKAYEKSLQLQADNAYVLNNYAYYLSTRNMELEKAERMAKKAVSIEPENSSFQDTYGWVLFKLGRYDEAKTWIGKAITNEKELNGELLEHYGDVLYRLNDTQDALDYWKRAKEKGGGSKLLDRKILEKKLVE